LFIKGDTVQPEYTLSLALVDFLPIIFSAFGLYYVARMVTHLGRIQGQMAMLGVVLIILGGIFKAVWKTINAATHGAADINWMEDSLFVFMAPGFIFLAFAIWSGVRAMLGKKVSTVWLVPTIIVLAMMAGSAYLGISRPEEPAWKRILLGMMVLANLVSTILLAVFAFREKMSAMGVLFIFNFVGVLILNSMARIPVQTISLQWIQEGINTVTWLMFAFAAIKIYEFTRVNFGVDAARVAQPLSDEILTQTADGP
jgi:hypothetical protein